MSCIDIRPFALPNTPTNEVRFEDPRDITRVVVTYSGQAPESVMLSYLRKTWPKWKLETLDPAAHSHHVGWIAVDDWFNANWHEASVNIERLSDNTLAITFKPLTAEFPDQTQHDVNYRRTLGIKVDLPDSRQPEKIEVYTNSQCAEAEVRVVLDAGKQTPTTGVKLSGYNINIKGVTTEGNAEVNGADINLSTSGPRTFTTKMDYLKPSHPFSYDEGLLTFTLDDDTFTISLDSLTKQGPIWFEDAGVFINFIDDPTTFEQYQARTADKKTISQMVTERAEQSFGGAMNGLPRAHPCACTVGCKHNRQRFWIEPMGDILMHKMNIDLIKGSDTQRFKNDGVGRLFFGLERWRVAGRHFDPAPILAYNIGLVRDEVMLNQKTFAVPLEKSIFDDIMGDDTLICLSRFTFTNTGDKPALAELPISYSPNSVKFHNRLEARDQFNDYLIPRSTREKLTVTDLGVKDASGSALRGIQGDWQGQQVLRCTFASEMAVDRRGDSIVLAKELAPGEQCEVILKIPYIALDQPSEIAAMAALGYENSYADVRRFWREEIGTGAQLKSGEPNIDALYKSHLAHVEVTDSRMPADPGLINTSVGSSTYGNFTNESVMIVEELDERGLHEQARQRVDVWLKYQGTKGLIGLFTDHDGVFYGAGGYEQGDSYDQHHGWVLWYIAKHFFFTGDADWLRGVSEQLIKGVDWVARQRNETRKDMPFSRGWERGFLAAGALEDVDDFFYWLSTNSLTWRGVDAAARALEAIDHPEAARVRAEADDYKESLIRGFEIARQHSPLVRLKDGRWIPHYPSRLYRRGRDVGWIREVLEGSVYLLISGLYDSNSKQAKWMLDDFIDNRYMAPYYSYPIYEPETSWVDYGGFSNQPGLLAGCLPHIDRDEPEIYIWMFFNSLAACYREEVNAMVEHPQPILGFSNSAIYKPSDQANVIKWLRYMYVYTREGLLHLGRALPRDWFRDGNEPYAEDVATHFGKVSIRYNSDVANGRITASVDLQDRMEPEQILVRFRHSDKLPVKSVTVNGKAHSSFDPEKGDVDITGLSGAVEIMAEY